MREHTHMASGSSPPQLSPSLSTQPLEEMAKTGAEVTPAAKLKFIRSTTAGRNASGLFTCTADALPKILAPHLNTLERLVSPCKVKPYFDYETYLEHEPSAEETVTLFSAFNAGIRKVFSQQAAEPDVLTGERHGWVTKNGARKYKVSFRGWARNFSIEYTLIKDAIIAAGCSALFDTTVYKAAEQLLGCINCTKDPRDARQLTPHDPSLPPSAFIVQHLEGEERPFVLMNPVKVEHEDVAARLNPEEFARQQLVSRHPINKLASVGSAEAVVKYLHLLGKHRWNDRAMWVKIATVLKNETGDQFKEEWMRLSQVYPHYNEADAEKVWATVSREDYTGPRLTLLTLIKWAKEDDPLGSQAVRRTELPPEYLELFQDRDRGLAELAYLLMADRAKRCGKNRAFYAFNRDRGLWEQGERDILLNPLSRELEAALKDIRGHYQDKADRAKELGEEEAERVFLENAESAGKAIARVQSSSGISAVLTFAAPLFHDNKFEHLLDSVPHLLGVRNGVVDLRTGELRARQPEDWIFTVVDVSYDPAAPTGFMDELVVSIMADNEAKASFLQLLLGYGITGEVCEEVFVVFTGSGRNGKGLLTQLLGDLLGDHFFKIANNAIITNRKASNLDAERGHLFGARIANFKELESGERLKTGEVQLLSGGDGIPATPKYKDPMVIKPRFLCILETNHMPELDQVIPAIVNRLLCVDFSVTFTDLLPGEEPTERRRQCDTGLKARLRGQLAGVLRWLVLGAMRWYATRDLKRMAPPEVKEFTRKYFEEQDMVMQFLTACCQRGPELKAGSTELLATYNRWITSVDPNGRLLNAKALAAALTVKGFEKKKVRIYGDSVWGYEGLGLAPGLNLGDGDNVF